MYSRIFNICRTSSRRVPNTFEISKRLCQGGNTTEKTEDRKPVVSSTKFPKYEVIYTFRFIKLASAINKTKRRQRLFALVSVPLSGALSLAGIIPVETAVRCMLMLGAVTLWIFSLGWYCNNIIAYVYYKKDEQKVILSYIDCYGKRKDIHTTVKDIPCLSDLPVGINDMIYRQFKLSSHNEPVKLPLLFGKLIKQESFELVFGKDIPKQKSTV